VDAKGTFKRPGAIAVALVLAGIALDRVVTRWVMETEVRIVFLQPNGLLKACEVDLSAEFFRFGRRTGMGDGRHSINCGDHLLIKSDVLLACRCP
jgi:hypothetical protein